MDFQQNIRNPPGAISITCTKYIGLRKRFQFEFVKFSGNWFHRYMEWSFWSFKPSRMLPEETSLFTIARCIIKCYFEGPLWWSGMDSLSVYGWSSRSISLLLRMRLETTTWLTTTHRWFTWVLRWPFGSLGTEKSILSLPVAEANRST